MASQNPGHLNSMGRDSIFMLASFPIALGIATILGILAGLGVGGGSLLMLWLTLVLNMPHGQAKLYNLLFFLPTALVTSCFRWKQGRLNIQKLLPGMIGGCITALVFSMVGKHMDTSFLKKVFGILLLAIGIKELFLNKKKPRQDTQCH